MFENSQNQLIRNNQEDVFGDESLSSMWIKDFNNPEKNNAHRSEKNVNN